MLIRWRLAIGLGFVLALLPATAALALDLVKDCAAVGDGKRDDTAAIQACARRLAAGGELYFPAGAYLISDSTVLPSGAALRGDGPASRIVAAPADAWKRRCRGAPCIEEAFTAKSGSDYELRDLSFVFPHGNPRYCASGQPFCGGSAHILGFYGAIARVRVRHVTSDGGGDLIAAVGASDVLVEGVSAANVSNSCFDFWGGTSDVRVIGNHCTSLPEAGDGWGGISMTGFNTDGSAAATRGLVAIGNQIEVEHGRPTSPHGGACIIVNGHGSAGTDDDVIIEGNTCTVRNGHSAWGILVTGQARNGIIRGNLLEGASDAENWESAIGVFAPAADWTITDNRVRNWRANLGGIFAFAGAAIEERGNAAVASSSPLYRAAASGQHTAPPRPH